ncbi:MAG: hypothetical protein HY685_04270 [Chloroflexi bacterium]|nr:hypothetical protein [Chloroflexota bacterium]
MARTQVNALVDSLWAAYRDCAEAAGRLSNAQLDTQVPSWGGRQAALRNMLYQTVNQPLEHTIHVAKILQVTGAPGAQPTEAQHILSESAEMLGMFTGLFARISDEDLDRSFENQTPRAVAEHVRGAIQNAQRLAGGVLEGRPAANP